MNAPERVALSQELSEFLIEFSIALHRYAMYPAGHPALRQAAAAVVHHVAALLYDRPYLSIGVAKRQLVIEGVATDTRNPVLTSLAARLHAHQIGALVFKRGVATEEVLGALELLAPEPDRGAMPLGLGDPARLQVWPNVRLHPMTYEQLELVKGVGGEAEGSGTRQRTRPAQLWIGLARAALAAEETGAELESTEPVHVARAINEHAHTRGYDQVIVGYLLQIAEELRNERNGAGSAALRRRMSRLVASLSPQTLRRLVEMGGDFEQRRRFVLDATEGLAVDAVVEIVDAAAKTSEQTISSSMLRLLAKLSAFAETGSEHVRPQADAALRDQVRELIRGWSLADPNPERYTAALNLMTRGTGVLAAAAPSHHHPEPLRIVHMSLELGVAGPSFQDAAQLVVADTDVRTMAGFLEDTEVDSTPAQELWGRLATKENVLRLLGTEPVEFDTLNRILDRTDPGVVANLLLDTLAEAGSRVTRIGLLERIVGLGPSVQPLVVARLSDARWFVKRNMLALLNEIGWPSDFSATPYLRHPEPAVRREAFQLAVRIPGDRDRAVCLALADKDGRAFFVGVRALVTGSVPEAAVPLIVNRVADDNLPTDVRTPLVRALSGVRSPLALDGLLRLIVVRRTLLGRPKLAPRSPELLAALTTLADTWSGDPRVRAVLERARTSSDPEIRAAANAARR